MEGLPQQIQVPQSLDVEAVERELASLWQESASADDGESEEALLRARAADLMIFQTNEAALAETHETVRDLALMHPCRALVMLAERPEPDHDIEMFVSAFCQTRQRSKKPELCCEEITLVARGKFASELPSAAIPLLVPDLPIFLWWRDLENLDDENFSQLIQVSDRLVIDSVDLDGMSSHLAAVAQLFARQGKNSIAVSDINWARLTSWRALLANFYDVLEYREALTSLARVSIEYEAPQTKDTGVAAQAVLAAGWLASRLQWDVVGGSHAGARQTFQVNDRDRSFVLELKRVEPGVMKPGRLSKIKLEAGADSSFVVERTDNNTHLQTTATIAGRACPGSTLPVRNRSTAQLLAREMEILGRDTTYEAAVKTAASFMESSGQ